MGGRGMVKFSRDSGKWRTVVNTVMNFLIL